MDNVVPDEVAQSEFDNFVCAMDLDLDSSKMDTEDAAQLDKLKTRVICAIKKGALVFNENGEAVYSPQNSKSGYKEPITFHERTGASLMAMDGKKKNQDIAKTYAVMGDMCKIPPNTFTKLVGIDVKVCEALYLLLMD